MKVNDVLFRIVILRSKLRHKEVARKLRISRSYLANIIAGRRKCPEDVLENFCRIMGFKTPKALLEKPSIEEMRS